MRVQGRKDRWTPDELEQLQKTWPRPHVPGRTRKGCIIKAHKLGYRAIRPKKESWSKDQDDILTHLYLSGMQIKHIARKLGKKPWEIEVRRAQLEIRRNKEIPCENVSIRIPVHIYETVQKWCLHEGVSRSRILNDLIEEAIDGRRARNSQESDAALRASPSTAAE